MPNKPRNRFTIYIVVRGLCLFGVFALGCGLFDQEKNKTGIVVGSRYITTDELKKDMGFISAGMDIPVEQQDQIRIQLIEQSIDHYLVLEYGKENGITLSEKELQSTLKDLRKEYSEDAFNEALLRGYVDFDQWKNRVREQLLVNKIIKKVTEGIAPPNYQEIKRYFEANQDDFRSPQMVEFRQIVTRAREEAENLLRRLHGGEQMSELARKYSIAPEAESGGKVGWVAKGHLNESMEKVLFSMPKGMISPVIETPYGYHIFEVLSVRPEGVKELPKVIEEIESKLLTQRREEFFEKWLQEMRSHFKVQVDQDLLITLKLR
jgi:parvulin-like peptidyl-prolyl isomerase